MDLPLNSPLPEAWRDVRAALHNYHLTATLGWQDVATRYRRSRVGAFWLTINMAVLIAALGFVFGTLFGQPMDVFLPYLAVGMIVWGFLSTVISEGCTGFISAEGIILQVRMPLFTHVMRILWRNIIIFGHNLLIVPLLLLAFMKPVSPIALLAAPGFALVVLNAAWMTLILAVVCARFRDMTQIVLNVMQVLFYLTPIIWSAGLLPHRAGAALINFNPFYHLISIVRDPLLGVAPTILNWIYSGLLMIFGWVAAMLIFGHYRRRVPYWL